MRVFRPFFTLLLLLVARGALAQSVHWDPPGGPLAVGQTTPVQLVFEDCEAKQTPAPPKVDGLTLEFVGQSTNMAFDNGSYTHSVTYTFAALLSKNQPIEIPAFQVETSKGTLTVNAARFDPAAATVGTTGRALNTAVSSQLAALPTQVWAGEVFALNYTILAGVDFHPDFGHGVFDWTPDPLTAEDWSQPERLDSDSGSEPRTGLQYHTRAIAPKPGTFQLNPVNQLINLSVGVTGFGFFQQRQYEQFAVPSSASVITVRQLPAPPPNFAGAVGTFTLTSKVTPTSAAVGDPVTWTLVLSGTGNWPAIAGLPAREISRDFQVIHPQVKKTPAAGKIFDATLTEDVVLIPTQAGTYTLPPVHFVYFDPRLGEYQTASTAAATVTITAPAAVTPPAATAPGSENAGAGPGVAAPALPAGLPHDPLPAAGSAAQPRSRGGWITLSTLPFALVLATWVWLARRRAEQTDPERRRRDARRRLGSTLAGLRGRSAGGTAALTPALLAWQRDTAVLWGLREAAPAASSLTDPAWSQLWAEADRILYGPAGELPPDWVLRAEQALATKAAPAFRSRQLWLRRNLFPFLVVAVGLLGVPRSGHAETAAAAYARGDFAAAEQAWRHDIAADPLNWSARENLSLALAQQERWPEAAATAAAAFVQQPQNPAVRREWALASERAGFVPEPLESFLSPGPLEWLARLASPGAWQQILMLAAVLGAAALAALLARGYGWTPRPAVRRAVLAVLVAAALAASVALIGVWAYGEAGSPTAVVVWRAGVLRSIPTEVVADQKTSPLPAGSTATVDKHFFSWVRLNFRNGETGWAPADDVVSLWQ